VLVAVTAGEIRALLPVVAGHAVDERTLLVHDLVGDNGNRNCSEVA